MPEEFHGKICISPCGGVRGQLLFLWSVVDRPTLSKQRVPWWNERSNEKLGKWGLISWSWKNYDRRTRHGMSSQEEALHHSERLNNLIVSQVFPIVTTKLFAHSTDTRIVTFVLFALAHSFFSLAQVHPPDGMEWNSEFSFSPPWISCTNLLHHNIIIPPSRGGGIVRL